MRKRVLFIEDEEGFSEGIKMTFEHLESPYDFTITTDSEKGLKLLEEKEFDIIIFDIKTNNENGNDAEIQAEIDDIIVEKNIPLIVCTGLNRSIEAFLELKNWSVWLHKSNSHRLRAIMDKTLNI